eukprot:jgi/Tetstr1/422849/TSEL_013640.t1
MGGGNHTAPAQAQGCLPGFRWRGGDDDDCQASLMGMDHPDGEHGKREKESERWWGGLEGGSKPGRGRVALQYRNGGVRTDTGHTVLGAVTGASKLETLTLNDDLSSSWGAVVLGTSSWKDVSMLNMPLGNLFCNRFLALARCKLWWMTPVWGRFAKEVPPETQFLLLELEHGGPYAILLPLIDGAFRATLRPPGPKCRPEQDNTLNIRIESGDLSVESSSWGAALLVAASWDPYALMEEAVTAAAALSGGGRPRTMKELPASLDAFGWCTWDAFYSRVSARGLDEGVKSLQNGGVPPKLVILDDGWQMTEVDEQHRMHLSKGLDEERVLKSQHSMLHHEAEELAQHASGSGAAAATMALIMEDSDGEADPPSCLRTNLLTRCIWNVLSVLVGWFKGTLEFLFLKFYENVVEPAEWDSRVVTWFTWCATRGPLKQPLLAFFATSGDFIHRLAGVRANHKFAAPLTGSHSSELLLSNLGDVVAHLRNRYDVEYFYCWHGLSGYWGGVSLEAPGASEFEADLVFANPTPGVLEVEPAMNWGPASLAGVGIVRDPAKLYQAMHKYLAEAGVTGVKVDCQAGVGLVPSQGGGPTSALASHTALEQSVADHFPGNHIINCMCHSTENFYRYKTSAIARACDDFYPRDPASHTSHIGNAAYNSLFLGVLVQPDWDMFQSKHPAAQLHAIARAASGSAVYVSDKPGEHDFSLLRRLVLSDGTVLRALLPGLPTCDTLFADPMCDGHTLLKVWNVNSVSSIVGVFNIQGASWDRKRRRFHIHDAAPPALWTRVRASDVWPIASSLEDGRAQEYVLWQSAALKLSHVRGSNDHILIRLPPGGSELVTVAPVLTMDGVRFAAIGLCELFNPGAAVMSCAVEAPNGNQKIVIGLRGFGVMRCYCNTPPERCEFEGHPMKFSFDEDAQTVDVQVPRGAAKGSETRNLSVLFRSALSAAH